MKYNVVIVEDEVVSRMALANMVDEIPWLNRTGEAESVKAAIEIIEKNKPDVLFLDIKIPGGTGLDILESATKISHVIFTTAYGEYAVEAFDHGAVDYLLKPFSRRRFEEAIEKLRNRLFDHIEEIKIFTKSGDRMLPIALEQVEYFRADKDYIIAHCNHGDHLLATTLNALEKQLDNGQYIRIHRSYIVNIHMVLSMQKYTDRRIKVHLCSGGALTSSRAGAKRLRKLIMR